MKVLILMLAVCIPSISHSNDDVLRGEIDQIMEDARKDEASALPPSAYISKPEIEAALKRSLAFNPKKAEEERVAKARAYFETKSLGELRALQRKESL